MVAVIIKNKVTDQEAYLPLAKAFAADARMETGCIEMKVYVDPEDKEHVYFITKWEAKSDFENHVKGEVFAKHIPQMGQYYVSGTDSILELAE